MVNVGFIKGTKFVIPVGDTSDIFYLNDVECVRLSFSNGGELICGRSQSILLDDGFREAIDCYNGSVSGVRIDGVTIWGKHDAYDITVMNEEHTYSVLVNGLEVTVHNIPIVTVIGSDWKGNYTKYIPYKRTETKTVVRKHFISDKPKVDQSNLVLLGGAFEEVGGYDEVIGGGSQKVGSKNK